MSECLDENTALELLEHGRRLPSSSRARIERHIESCDACRELVVELTRGQNEEGETPVDTVREPAFSDVTEVTQFTHAGPYRIEREIGRGGAGTVYRAVDDPSGTIVALKHVTDPAWRTRFAREVATLARLVHPGIVRYIAHGETTQGMYLAMEWLEGEDLQRALLRGPLPWPAVRLLGLRLTAALAYAHTLGAVHRDLSTRNVFLPAGRVEQAKLLDFGLVRVRDALHRPHPTLAAAWDERTASQAIIGTPNYMAPEQVKDPRNVDARSDLFALGVVFFECLSGVRPFHAADLFTVWVRIVDQPAPDLRPLVPDVPEPFVRLIERLLAKEPDARPGSAADVHQVLVQLDLFAPSQPPTGFVATAMVPPYTPSTARTTPSRPMVFPSHSGGPHVFVSPSGAAPASDRLAVEAGTAPTSRPPSMPSSVPSKRGSGVFAAAGVGVTALVAASAIAVVGPRVLRRASTVSIGNVDSGDGSNANAGSEAARDEDASDESPSESELAASELAMSGDAGEPSIAAAAPAIEATETLFCGAQNVELRRGGNYQPARDARDREPVLISGECKATLEDCIIGGHRSISVLGKAELTLRRCRVTGETRLNGDVMLTLEGTTLASAPIVVGKGRVLRR